MQLQGIVLQSLKFKDYDQILTVFTRENGLIKLFVKGAYNLKQGKAPVATLTQIECIYTQRQSSLYTCQELSTVNYYLDLRNSYQCLESACTIAKAILDSQPEHKPAPLLYDLFVAYLNRLPSTPNPSTLESSFLLKTLRYEGLLGLTPHCNICQDDLTEHYLYHGESFCKTHAPPHSIQLSPFEAASLFTLTFSRDMALIETAPLSPQLKQTILSLFDTQIHH
jgi:DNA repair protein RecO (recombination protein O)